MESEARNQNNDYNEFFYATMCHICKRFSNSVPLKSCGSCRMISYCGPEHQKQHWKEHKPLCKAIQDVLRKYSMDYRGETTQEWTDKKLIFMRLVSCKLGRHLKLGEIQMLKFPKECRICYEKNDKLLEDCQKCAASFCKNHKDDTEHRNVCASLELGLRLDLLIVSELNPLELLSNLKRVSDVNTCQNMKDFIYALGNTTDSVKSDDILIAEKSEYLSRPLTLLYAMRLLDYVPKGKDLVIHVVGANHVEVVTLLMWQVLLHFLETVMSVVIIMIGPDLKKFNGRIPSRTWNKCISLTNKSIISACHCVSYENYVLNSSFVKPDLIVGFNLGVHELGFNKGIWPPSIYALGKQNCPVVLTFFTLRDFEKGTNKISTILDEKVDYLFSGKNPFASLRPHRVLGPEHVYYHNQYVVIYQSLFVSDIHKESTTEEGPN